MKKPSPLLVVLCAFPIVGNMTGRHRPPIRGEYRGGKHRTARGFRPTNSQRRH